VTFYLVKDKGYDEIKGLVDGDFSPNVNGEDLADEHLQGIITRDGGEITLLIETGFQKTEQHWNFIQALDFEDKGTNQEVIPVINTCADILQGIGQTESVIGFAAPLIGLDGMTMNS
jgi:hypothetical protein